MARRFQKLSFPPPKKIGTNETRWDRCVLDGIEQGRCLSWKRSDMLANTRNPVYRVGACALGWSMILDVERLARWSSRCISCNCARDFNERSTRKSRIYIYIYIYIDIDMKLDRRMVRASLVCVLFLFSILSLFFPPSLFTSRSLWRIKRHEMPLAFSRIGICQILSSEARVEIYNSRNAIPIELGTS